MIAYLDLLAIPYKLGGLDPAEGLDCRGLAIEVYRRAGIEIGVEDFEPAHLSGSPTGWCGQRMDGDWPDGGTWEEVDIDEIVPLDLIAADLDGSGFVTGVAVALSGDASALCLTAVPRAGVVALPVRRITGRVGIYRRVSP